MRELTMKETHEVSGGWGPWGAIGGGILGAYSGYRSSGWRGAAAGAAFGAYSGFTGSYMMSATAGFMRASWGARSIAGEAIANDLPRYFKRVY